MWVYLCVALSMYGQNVKVHCKPTSEMSAKVASEMCPKDPIFDCTSSITFAPDKRKVYTLIIKDVANLTTL